MTDATGRARAGLIARFNDVVACTPYASPRLAADALAFLVANPDLLAGLALEAGGLEQVGWQDVDAGETAPVYELSPGDLHPNSLPHRCFLHPVYRRKEKTT